MIRRGWGVAEKPWRNPATQHSSLAAFKCASANACLNTTIEVAVTSIMGKVTSSSPSVCAAGFAGFLWCAHQCTRTLSLSSLLTLSVSSALVSSASVA